MARARHIRAQTSGRHIESMTERNDQVTSNTQCTVRRDNSGTSDHFEYGNRSWQVLVAACTVFAVVSLWPLAVFVHPGMQDYPNHLARAFILLRSDDAILASNYSITWTLAPNLAFEAWMMSVGRLVSIDVSGRACILFSSLALVAGVFALARAMHGRASLLQLLAFPLIFNSGFNFGFLGYNMAMAVMLFAAAWWEKAADGNRSRRLVGGTGWATLLYLLHFGAFGGYGLYVLGTRLREFARADGRTSRMRSLGALVCDGVQAAPAAALFLIARVTSSESANVGRAIDKFEMPQIRIGQVERLLDVDGALVNGGLLALLIAALAFTWIIGRLRVDPKPLPTITIAVALFFVLPDSIYGTNYASWRVLLAAALFFVAALTPTERFGTFSAGALLGVIAFVLCVASAATAVSWARTEQSRHDMLQTLRGIPDGSCIFNVQTDTPTRQERRADSGVYHLAAYAVIEHRALVQSMFTASSQQPLRFRDPIIQSALSAGVNRIGDLEIVLADRGLAWPRLLAHFDYVLAYGEDDPRQQKSLPESSMLFAGRTGRWWLFRLDPEGLQNGEEKSRPR
jgi:hypothetical protein